MGGTRTAISGTPATTAGTPIWTRTDGKLPFPAGTYRPAEGIGDDLLAHLESGPDLGEPAQRGRPDLGRVEQAAVVDRLADAGEEGRVAWPRGRPPARRAGRGGPAAVEADAVEALGGVEDGGVAAGLDVLEEGLDRALEAGLEDGGRGAGEEAGLLGGRRGRPSGGRRGWAWLRERSGSAGRIAT